MDFDAYQRDAKTTAIYDPAHRVVYPALGLASEAGEVAGKVKKALRDGGGDMAAASRDIADELGDVLWYLAVLADDLDLSLDQIARRNLDKLRSRAARGRIGGEGDVR